MKIGIYSGYQETLGGGERYIMTIAECLSLKGNQVDVFWDKARFKDQLAKRFSLNLKKVEFVKNVFAAEYSRWQKWRVLVGYDVIFFVSDGSLPFLPAKRNILHFQVPFTGVRGKRFSNRLKLLKIDRVICNSAFTQRYVDREYGFSKKSRVIYPPVDVTSLKPGRKKKLILSVGRFGEPLHDKKQSVLIDAFQTMLKSDGRGLLKDWRLLIVGGLRKGDDHFLRELKKQARGAPIDFLVNQPFAKLRRIYAQAKIFWHAAGFGEIRPERMEHFGMVVVEAMAAGVVPVVYAGGGIPEIVTNGKSGWLWRKQPQLIKQTLQLIESESLWNRLSLKAIKDAQRFNKRTFCRQINELVKK
jgi:glycosyltransferase involved in cell wall biosynthesis